MNTLRRVSVVFSTLPSLVLTVFILEIARTASPGASFFLYALAVVMVAMTVLEVVFRGRRQARAANSPRANAYLGDVGLDEAPLLTEPVRAWKVADLHRVVSSDGAADVLLGAMHYAHTYSARAEATCLAGRNHYANAMSSCSCGFHAYVDEASARSHNQANSTSVVLEVVGSGHVVRHERGWRFSVQRVRSVHVRRCAQCRRDAAVFAVRDRRHRLLPVVLAKDALVPLCRAHALGQPPATSAHAFLTFDEVASSLSRQAGAPVAVSSNAPALTRAELGSPPC